MANNKKVGLVFGLFLALWHLVWSVMVGLGLAQPFLNFIFWLHMTANPFQVMAFNLMQAILLIAVTFGVGYIFGYAISTLWNKFNKQA
jgi:hypothetical protein